MKDHLKNTLITAEYFFVLLNMSRGELLWIMSAGWRIVQVWLRFMLVERFPVIFPYCTTSLLISTSFPLSSLPLWWMWEFALSSQQVGPNHCSNCTQAERVRDRNKGRGKEKEGRGLTGIGRGNLNVFTEPFTNNNRLLLFAVTLIIVLYVVGWMSLCCVEWVCGRVLAHLEHCQRS